MKIVTLVYLVSLLALPLLFIDYYMHPICPQCGNNLNAKRLGLGKSSARCKKHGDFVVKKSE